jgi:hypothetical protein
MIRNFDIIRMPAALTAMPGTYPFSEKIAFNHSHPRGDLADGRSWWKTLVASCPRSYRAHRGVGVGFTRALVIGGADASKAQEAMS